MADVDRFQPGEVSWIDLVTTDPSAARDFYGALFGWDFDIGPPETGRYTLCRVRGRAAAGMNGTPSERVAPAWTTYFFGDDLAAAAQRLGELGGRVTQGPLDIPGQGELVVAGDPTGAVFGLWRPDGPTARGVRGEPGALSWHEHLSRDLSAAATFYGGLFGYAWEEVDTGPGGPAYRTFAVAGEALGGALAMDDTWPASIGAHWMPYFTVADADAAASTAEHRGGRVEVPPVTSPWGRFAALADPQGAVFSVIDPTTRG